jgi:hypothetical protein
MPQSRFYCSKCKQSIYNVLTDGVRVPIVAQIVFGQPEDTGPPLDINGPGVKVPSAVREVMQPHVPIKRLELCNNCFAETFGLKLVTAQDDPMYSVEQADETKKVVLAAIEDPDVDAVSTQAVAMERVILAAKVGRGEGKAPALPKPVKVSK